MSNKWRKMEREITALLKELKKGIGDDYRATDDKPGMCVTVSTKDGESWHYQTGDNSFTGACYHDPHWSVIYLYRRSKSAELAREAVDELEEAVGQSEPERDEPQHPQIDAEIKANARLIAAAPELLEALEKLSEVFAAYVDVETVVNAEIADAWNTARNAIAKAKGGMLEVAESILNETGYEGKALRRARKALAEHNVHTIVGLRTK